MPSVTPVPRRGTLLAKTFGLQLPIEDVLSQSAATLLRQIAEYKVVVLRQSGTAVDINVFVRLMEALGSVSEHPLDNFVLPGRRGVLVISNLYRNGVAIGVHEGGTYWHTDMAYKEHNCVLTALYSVNVPRDAGASATEFIDCEIRPDQSVDDPRTGHLAYPAKGLDIEAYFVLHRFGNRERFRNPEAATQELSVRQRASFCDGVHHPLVLVHPITSRKFLYGVAATSVMIEGLTIEASQVLLDGLFEYLLAHAPRYMHYYLPGDIVIWDNLTTLHRGKETPKSSNPQDCRLLYRMNVDYSCEARAWST